MSRYPHLSILLSLILLIPPASADLHDPSNSADYLIVSTQQLINAHPWITRLTEWRTQHGRVSMVVPVEYVWEEFGDGSPSDTTLKEFLHYARLNWQPPQLRDVFIVGFHDVVPSHVQPDSIFVSWNPDSFYYVPSDYLSDFFFATDPESTNYMPVLSIGRLPWSLTQSPTLPNYYDKVVAYETAEPAPWQTRVHLIADYNDNHFHFWEDFCEPLASLVPYSYTIERDYLDFEEEHPWHGDREEILDNFQSGSYFVAYMGHGGGDIWSGRLELDSSDFASLTNGHHLPIVTKLSYDITRNQLGGIVATLLANPNGGAIACFGRSTVAWANAGRRFEFILLERATSDSIQKLGEVWQQTEEAYIRTYGISGDNYRQTAFGCLLFGDPGLRLPERVSTVDDDIPTIPADMCLEGNYPNPFNSTTKITYRLNRATKVSLKIYDVLGREVTTLVEDFKDARSYTISWNAAGAPSGVYFCWMEAPGFAQTRKMMLIK